jgi:hypothetical protein
MEIKTLKIRMLVSRGNPSGGAIIRAGATIEIAEFWAKKFIAEGSAELVEESFSSAKISSPKREHYSVDQSTFGDATVKKKGKQK